MGIRQIPSFATIRGVGGAYAGESTAQAYFRIMSVDGSYTYDMFARVLDDPTGDLEPSDWNSKNYPHFKDIKFPDPIKGEKIKLLIGSSDQLLHASKEEVDLDDRNLPIARRTRLGWTAIGPHGPIKNPRVLTTIYEVDENVSRDESQ